MDKQMWHAQVFTSEGEVVNDSARANSIVTAILIMTEGLDGVVEVNAWRDDQ